MKRILIDLSHIRQKIHAGIYNAAIDIVKGLLKYSDYELVLLIWEDQEDYIDNWVGTQLEKILLPLNQKDYLDKTFKIKYCPDSIIQLIEKKGIDLIFTTCYTFNSYIFPKKYNQLGIIYDMQPYHMAKSEGHWKYALYWLAYSIVYYRLLRNILVISDYIGKEVKKYSGRNSQTIYLSYTERNISEETIESLEGVRYILDVNSFVKHKNTERLIRAFSLISDKFSQMVLYLKGYSLSEERNKAIQETISSLNLKDRVIIDANNRSSAEMAYLYNHADLFVSPSLMEGFGLTPIEAAMHGCQITVSDIPTLVEVTDGKVPTFDPLSEKSIADTIEKLLRSPMPQDRKEYLACYYSGRYSHELQSKKYIDVINGLLNID